MPITRSQGKAPAAWVVDTRDGQSTATRAAIRHEAPPRSPSTADSAEPPPPPRPVGLGGPPLASSSTDMDAPPSEQKGYRQKGDSDKTIRNLEGAQRHAPTSVTQEQGPIARSSKTHRTDRSNRRVLKAREDILKIKLELAQIALKRAEIEGSDDDYEEDGQSKTEYVRSWLEDNTNPPIVSTEDTAAAEGGADSQQKYTTPPPLPEDINKNPELQQLDPPDKTIVLAESDQVGKHEQVVHSVKKDNSEGGDTLRPFISELTSAIAALAHKTKPADAPMSPLSPAVSKVIMTLPPFSGVHTEWLSFRAIYETTRGYFNDIENTARLRRSLKGRALETVSSELIGHARPDDIMRELELQFGRPDSIAQAETEKLRTLPRCTEAPRDICTFASKIRSGVVTLRALKKDHYLINAELLRSLTEKLPNSIRVQWYKTFTEKYNSMPDLGLFSDFVTEQARYCSAFAPPEPIHDTQQKRAIHRTHTTVKGPSPKCRICEKEGHYASDCAKFEEANSDKRWELAKKHGLCFRCLRSRHQQHSCKSRKCGTNGCTATHHRLLHYVKKETAKISTSDSTEIVANSQSFKSPQAYLKILPVRVIGPAGETITHALLDDGSTVSLMDEEIAKIVGADGRKEPLKIGVIGNVIIDTPGSRKVDVALLNPRGERLPFTARTVPSLRLAPQTVSKEDIIECKHLIDLTEELVYNAGTPKILIGQDNWNLLIANEIRRGPNHQPIASLTELGWVLHGAYTRTLGQRVHFVNNIKVETDNIEAQLKEYFSLESLFINPRRPTTDPEKRAEDILNAHTRILEDGHVETALLWKEEKFEMPDNYENAMKRLASIEKKIDRDPNLKDRYEQQMESLIQKKYAEIAPKLATPGRTWYLPHFDVHNPMKPEKLRIVHDAAAKTKGRSLNDYLLTGPDLLQSLPGVLMRFRRHRIAVSADITEMFMQVKVRPEDRDALRYLWRGKRREGAPQEYRMKSIIFGAASSPCTAIYAKNWNANRHATEYPEAVEAIVNNHYMDDYLDSFHTLESALRTSKQVKDIHRNAHFELRKWVSNATEVIENLEPSQESKETVHLGCKGAEEKILGLIWKPNTDELTFNLKLARLPTDLLHKKKPTKREALRVVMSIYDPLGLASPVTIRAKQILQEAWRRGTGWDQDMDDDLAAKWSTWLRNLDQLGKVNLPRCYPGFSEAESLEVHVFTDASEVAYATAVYWRTVTPDKKTEVTLVTAKARVAPLKVTSIPRLELQAAVMGSRVATAVIQEHRVKPQTVTFWTDSKTVLTWLKRGARSYKPFVAHRVAAIEEYSKVEDWRWVPTKLNVADIATRDVPPNFDANHEWYRGPAFLYEDPSSWPTERPIIAEATGEEKTLTVTSTRHTPSLREAVPEPARFSKWERLLRATARALQFITLCRKKTAKVFYKRTRKNPEDDPDWRKVNKKPKTPKYSVPSGKATPNRKYITLEAEFIKEAEQLLVRAIQEDSFKQEIIDLRGGQNVANNSRLRPLPIELRNDIIILRSRIDAAEEVTEEAKRPPVLDGDHYVTQLYIDWTHRSLHHSGTELVINEIRQHYWIIRVRPTTKKIVGQCLRCRIQKAKPPQPATGDLPKARLAHHHRPFTYTGLDYFGPLSVTIGRQHQKRYVALFTCLTTRAVHLEIAASLSADSAVLALRRFAARRGCPSEIYSDNGTNMHGADKELQEAIKEEASLRGMKWRFITPAAPFMGGAWERLVRCVKTTLYTVLHEKHPHEEVLATLLCEAEYTVNSRPLTHVSVECEDDESITPNHFLLGGSARLPTPGSFDERDLDHKKHWRRSQILADMFWRRWVREYLPELQYRREPHSRGPNLQVGDPVLIADGQLPRNTWPRGRVEAVYPGADGQIRTVEVRTAGGILKRPAKKLVPLPK